MINFLAATHTDAVDKLILLPQIPTDHKATLHVIKEAVGDNVQVTRSDVEHTEVEIAPINYREHVGQYLLHVIQRTENPRNPKRRTTVHLYKIEPDNFYSVRKIIIT